MHKTQKLLLKRLKLANGLRYSALTQGYNFDDNIVFHLNQIVDKRLAKKRNALYFITTKGAKHIARYYLPTLDDHGQKTFFVGFLCEFENEVLIKEHAAGRHKFYNFPSGKPFFGEDMDKALPRLFFEETSATLSPKAFRFNSMHLKTMHTSKGDALYDDAFAVYSVKINKNEYDHMKMKRGSKWFPKSQVMKLPNKWPEIDICLFKIGWKPYLVYTFESDYILHKQDL